MNNKIFGKEKIICSLISIIILCSASTIVPSVNGNNIINITNQNEVVKIANDKILNPSLWERIYNGEIINYKEIRYYFIDELKIRENKINFIIFNKFDTAIRNYFDDQLLVNFNTIKPYINKNGIKSLDLIHLFNEEIYPIFNQFKIYNSIDALSNSFSKTISDHDSIYFKSYWDNYEVCRKRWSNNNYYNYYDWNVYAKNTFDKVIPIMILLMILNVGSTLILPDIPDLFLKAITVPALLILLSIIYYIWDTEQKFSGICLKEVNIILHITNRTGFPIRGLEKVKIFSINVKEEYPGELPFFTYSLQESQEMVDSKPGHYTIHYEPLDEKYKLAPPPPGYWQITLDEQYGIVNGQEIKFQIYENETNDLPPGSVLIYDVLLEEI